MIFFLTTKKNKHPICNYLLSHWGRKHFFNIQPITYEKFILKEKKLAGIYIFSDIELLTDEQRKIYRSYLD